MTVKNNTAEPLVETKLLAPLYHASYSPLPPGTKLIWQSDGYTLQKAVSDIEDLMEEVRPKNGFSRKKCVFLADNIADLDNLGAHTDYIYRVEPTSVQKSDLSFYALAKMKLDEGKLDEAKEAARAYWRGDTLEGVFEYRAMSSIIVNEI